VSTQADPGPVTETQSSSREQLLQKPDKPQKLVPLAVTKQSHPSRSSQLAVLVF
jgi:hypothetical protein